MKFPAFRRFKVGASNESRFGCIYVMYIPCRRCLLGRAQARVSDVEDSVRWIVVLSRNKVQSGRRRQKVVKPELFTGPDGTIGVYSAPRSTCPVYLSVRSHPGENACRSQNSVCSCVFDRFFVSRMRRGTFFFGKGVCIVPGCILLLVAIRS